MSARSYRHEVGVGLIVLLAAGMTGWLALRVGSFGMGDYNLYTADFSDAAGIKSGASVSVAGVDIGKVDELELESGRARLTLRVSPEIALHQDARALIRARSVLGEKYIALEPGSSDAPALDGTHIRDSVGQVEIDQLLTQLGSVFDGVDPERLGLAVDSIAAAFENDPERPARILESAEGLLQEMRDLAEHGSELAREGQQAAETVGSLSHHAQNTLSQADQMMADLGLAAGHLPTAAESLPLLMEDARGATADLRELLDGLNAQSAAIERVLANLSEIDKWELRRLLREEGILIRLRQSEVQETEAQPAPSDR